MDVKNMLQGVASKLRRLGAAQERIEAQHELILKQMAARRSITAEIDAIPGRRLWYGLTGRVAFTAADQGQRGQPVNFRINQDGPFIQTHYPFALWLPSAPNNATMFGLWRPVTPYPLPDQFTIGAVDGDSDLISISYEVVDAGSQRNFQNERQPPVLSRPDLMIPLPVPTLFTPNTTIQFTPFYERILFNNTVTPPTEGILVVQFPGYLIANM